MSKHILHLQSHTLVNTNLKREHSLLKKESNKDKAHEFDANTLFYDIVSSGSATLLYCPKLLNLESLINTSEFYIDDVLQKITIKKSNRYDIIKIKGSGSKLTIKNHEFNENWEIKKFDASRFSEKNCIVTMNKNNKLEWISDFVKFHIKHHNLDAIVIFDNGSNEYTPHDLEICLHKTGISDFLIVNTPFPYGPIINGSNRSLCFLQTALLNLSKVKLFTKANAVLSIDIDELVWSTNKTIFQIAQSSLLGFVLFKGEWRLPANDNQAVTHKQHQYFDQELKPCPTKYCYSPNKIARWLELAVHRVYFKRTHLRNIINYLLVNSSAGYWHCRGISTNWKNNRKINNPNLNADKFFIKHFTQ